MFILTCEASKEVKFKKSLVLTCWLENIAGPKVQNISKGYLVLNY